MDNDIFLIEEFKNGNDDAFKSLITKYEKKIYSLCYYFMGNQADAEDSAQDAIIKVYRNLNNFRGESTFSTWLQQVVSNSCRDALRKRKRNTNYSTDNTIETEEGSLIRNIEDKGPGPEEQTEKEELTTLILTALTKLKFEHKEILILREYQNLSYEEIADILKCSVGTVKSRLSRARHEFKKIAEGMEQFDGYIRQKSKWERREDYGMQNMFEENE